MRRVLGALTLAALTAFAAVAAGEAGAGGPAAQEKPAARPERFGEQLRWLGTKGIGPRQMTWVTSVAVDSRGYVYAGDRDIGRVQRFDPAGKLESLLYFESYQVDGLACDRAGVLYVLYDGSLLRYDPATWTLLGEIERPRDSKFLAVAPAPDGGVVALRENSADEILWIDKEGKIARTLPNAMQSVTDSSLRWPRLASDSKGYVYVGDDGSSRIYKFDPKGRFLSHFQFSADAADASHENLHALAIDRQDRLWVGGWNSTNIFAADGRFLQQLKGLNTLGLATGEGDRIYSAERTGIAEYAAGTGLGSPSAGEPPQERAPRDPWAGVTKDQLLPSHQLYFQAPAGSTRTGPVAAVAVDAQGFVYTAYPESLRVLRFSPSGERQSPVEIPAAPKPWTGMAVDRGGTLYLAAGNRLFRYEVASGKLLGEVKHPDGPGFFDVTPRPDFGVLASWRNAKRDDLVLVGKDGTIETLHRDAVSGAAGEPVGDVRVAMDGWRRIYTAVDRLHAVCVFDFAGKYKNRFGSGGDEPGQLSGAITGIAADGQEQVFVSDAKSVNVFSATGRFLNRLDFAGTYLAVDEEDDLFAANGTQALRSPHGSR
jgi:sugar lactone lactonase YvrE